MSDFMIAVDWLFGRALPGADLMIAALFANSKDWPRAACFALLALATLALFR